MKKILIYTISLLFCFSLSADIINVKPYEHVLPNGLKVLMYINKDFPSVACRLFYKIGSVNEYPGISGSAHLLEHMMFKGTKKIGVKDWPNDSILLQEIENTYNKYDSLSKTSEDTVVLDTAYKKLEKLISQEKSLTNKEELWNLYVQEGGTELNAFTTDILTAYFVTLPKNKIELFFWLESDRMQNAVFREFYSERDVVAEERRLRYENQPTGRYWETLNSIFYEAHPYRIPTIGWMSDILNTTKTDIENRFDLYYRPDNAILVFAGDIDTAEITSMSEKYFGKIKKEKAPPKELTIQEPKQAGEKRFAEQYESAPRIDLLFHTPAIGDSDLYPLDIIEGVLSGRNGRLYKRLVKELELCTNTGAENGVEKYTGYFHVFADLKEDTDPDKVEKLLLEELEKLKTDTLADYELQRVKNNVAAYTVNSLRKTDEIANQLGFWDIKAGWRYINIFPQKVQEVTKNSVSSAAQKYFIHSNRTVGVLTRKKPDKKETIK